MPMHPEHLARLIADDHAKLEATLRHLEAGFGDRRALLEVLAHDIAVHAGAEEIVVYPAVRDLPRRGGERADAALEDQLALKEELLAIQGLDGDAEQSARLAALIADLRVHLAEEEQQLLPGMRARLGDDRLVELGHQFAAIKADLPTRVHKHLPSAPPANLAGAALVATVDRARDRLSRRRRVLGTDHSGLLDLDAQELVDALAAAGGTPVELLTPEAARRQPTLADAVRAVRRRRGEPLDREPVALVVNRVIPGPRGRIPLRIHAPEVADGASAPVVLLVHGGGWVLGNLDRVDALARTLANQVGCVVVSVGYRRAPEHPFPAAHDDVLAATRWVLDHAAAVGGDGSRLALAGEEVGATMALAAACQLAREEKRRLRFLLLAYPLASGTGGSLSRDDSADGVPLNRAMLSWSMRHALADPADALDPRIHLVGRPLGDLSALPPTLVLTAERDPLRSEGEELAQRLADAGVEVTATRYEGMPHGFLSGLPVVETARRAVSQATAMLRRHLGAPALARRHRHEGEVEPRL